MIQTKLTAHDKARELAQEALAKATAKVQLSGFSELEQAMMDDRNLRAKMAAVARLIDSDPTYAKTSRPRN